MLSLKSKTILVTGVSRSKGIGAAIARLLASSGANVIIHGYAGYDEQQKYPDANLSFADDLVLEMKTQGIDILKLPSSDLSGKEAPEQVVKQAADIFGSINGLVLNHAYSTWAPFGQWTAEDIDAHMNINVRASMLMIQAFARQLPEGESGAVTLFTSGQYLRPMVKEIPYAVSKDAIICLCKQTATALAPQGIRVNCINPGATDTGYLDGERYESVAKMFPSGKWLVPEDAARLVHFLQSDYSRSVTGEVIASEAGFNVSQFG